MNCQTVQDQLTDYLIGQIDEDARDLFDAHFMKCPDCRARLQELQTVWRALGTLPRQEPSPLLRQRFYAMLSREKEKRISRKKTSLSHGRFFPKSIPRLAVITAVFIIGLFMGYVIGGHRIRNGRLLQPGQEVQSIKQSMSISMLQQSSPFERMKGAHLSTEVDQPGDLLIQMLFAKINTDPSVPVRLAAVDAMGLFSNRSDIQSMLINSLLNQESPLVQIAIVDQLTYIREKKALAALKMLIENQDTQPEVKSYVAKKLHELS